MPPINPVVGLYHDTRSPSKKNGGKSHVKVRITWNNDVRYLLTKQFVSTDEFKIIEAGKAKTAELRKAQESVFQIRANANDIIKTFEFIGIDRFFYEYDKKYGATRSVQNPMSVKLMLEELIAEKEAAEDIGTAISYNNAKVSILKYGGEDLKVTDITPEWLKGYELWMTDTHGRSLNTVGFYLRPLRSICIRAVEKHYISEDRYPFVQGKYVIRKKRIGKRGLPENVKDNILNFQPSCENEAMAIDFSTFTFIAHGMNMSDIAYLHESNFRKDHFIFIRRKTRKTVLVQKEIRVPLGKELREIIMRRGIHKGYIFGVITEDMDARTRKKKINNWIGVVNDWLKKIAIKIDYDGKVTTYSWRHTFVSILLNNNVPLTKVKDALGHESITTTQDYAEDLDLETAKGFTDLLIKQAK